MPRTDLIVLIQDILRKYRKPSALVSDPCLSTGAPAMACLMDNKLRQVFGCEKYSRRRSENECVLNLRICISNSQSKLSYKRGTVCVYSRSDVSCMLDTACGQGDVGEVETRSSAPASSLSILHSKVYLSVLLQNQFVKKRRETFPAFSVPSFGSLVSMSMTLLPF